jgi:hypothetical protein
MGLGVYLTEILMNPLAIAVVAALSLGPAGLGLLKLTFVSVVIMEYFVLFAVNSEDRRNPVIIALYPFCIIVKAAALFFVFLAPFFSLAVKWRGRRIKIGHLSRIIDISEPQGKSEDRDCGEVRSGAQSGAYANEGKKAWVVSIVMGLGQMRAAYPLRDIAEGGIIVDGTRDF